MSVSVMSAPFSTTTVATTQAVEMEEELGPTLIKKLEVSKNTMWIYLSLTYQVRFCALYI